MENYFKTMLAQIISDVSRVSIRNQEQPKKSLPVFNKNDGQVEEESEYDEEYDEEEEEVEPDVAKKK